MIIDRIQLAGRHAYFEDGSGDVNIAGHTSRTSDLGKGKQLEISGIELLIESESDLTEVFKYQDAPLISVTIVKEMFPALFSDPFRHRVHSIAGFEDFNRGKAENCKAMDVEGIPTLVSLGTDTCVWNSPRYRLPESIKIDHSAWELAASRRTPKENFVYTIVLNTFNANGAPITSIEISSGLDPTEPRLKEGLDLQNVHSYELVFKAEVKRDAALYEKHTTLIGESVGTPLLRAINLLEPIDTIYEIHSLQELLSRSSQYHLFEFQGQPINKMLATLDLSATLVHSEQQDLGSNKFEFIEITVAEGMFSNLEAKLLGEELFKVSK